MEQYFKYTDEEGVQCFLELDEEFYCERTVYKTENELINTYLTIEHQLYFLPEGNMKESLEFMNASSKTEFENHWEESMNGTESDWKKIKRKYQIGDLIKSKILCFYPQGIILNFGEPFNALSNYEACKTVFGKDKMYPNQELDLKISAFDNINRIVILTVN